MSAAEQAAREEAAMEVLRKHFTRESDDMHEVAPRLWVGSRAAARNTDSLRAKNITHGLFSRVAPRGCIWCFQPA